MTTKNDNPGTSMVPYKDNPILDMQQQADQSYSFPTAQGSMASTAASAAPNAIANVTPVALEAEAIPASVASGALWAGLGIGAVTAGMAGIQALGAAVKSPQGSISGFMPGGGGGGGADYAADAMSQSMLAALNSAGKISTRLGG